MWEKMIADTGGVEAGFWACHLLDLNSHLEMFGASDSEMSARDVEGLKSVRAAINRRRAYLEWQASRPKENQ